tara:strand:- start:1278 stop:1736 length:459 start_codon:yes stop_codon:yes gene_type:complete
MIFISHRGNISGKNIALENDPIYIDSAISMGYDVETDIRIIDNCFFLGHDTAQHKVNIEWIMNRKNSLWIHAKNLNCLNFFSKHMQDKYRFFWHQNDDYTLTSNNIIWAYPGSVLSDNSIAVMPENAKYKKEEILNCYGICSDFISLYEENK